MNAFLSALKQTAKAPTFQASNPQPATAAIEPLRITVDRVLSNNRLDIFFSRKPEESTLNSLRAQGFWWDVSRKCWYHKDTLENRDYLRSKFNADFGEEPTPMEDNRFFPVDPEVVKNAVSNFCQSLDSQQPPIEHPIEAPEFARYKNQVNELMAHLNMDAADLMIYAIDQLYRNTIAN